MFTTCLDHVQTSEYYVCVWGGGSFFLAISCWVHKNHINWTKQNNRRRAETRQFVLSKIPDSTCRSSSRDPRTVLFWDYFSAFSWWWKPHQVRFVLKSQTYSRLTVMFFYFLVCTDSCHLKPQLLAVVISVVCRSQSTESSLVFHMSKNVDSDWSTDSVEQVTFLHVTSSNRWQADSESNVCVWTRSLNLFPSIKCK